jgi:hypothetical protein
MVFRSEKQSFADARLWLELVGTGNQWKMGFENMGWLEYA